MDLTDTGEMIVKRVSVPIGLEELMEGLVKEVLLKKPDDIYIFAAKYFSQLLLFRDKGQTKVKTIRSAQSLTDQREKRFPMKIPVSGVTKQLSRQFSVRGESPMRNFDSPIISQKPKMHDRNESKYRRRNTGPPTIPENHMNIAVRKKYSRSVSTERKRETNSISSTKKITNKKETKEMQDVSNEKSVRNKNDDKRNSVTKELQKNFNLIKNKPTDEVVRKISGQRNISEKGGTIGDASVTETADSNGSVQSNNEIQQVMNENSQASTELLVYDDLDPLPDKTAAPVHNSNVESSKKELQYGESISKENVVEVADGIESDGSADGSIIKTNNGIEVINRNDDDKQRKNEPIDDDEKLQTMESLSEVNVKNSDEVLKVDSKIDASSEKSKSPSDTLDNLTMESENAEMSIHKEGHFVPVNSYENDKDTTKNLETTNASDLSYNDSKDMKEDSKEEENREHVAEVTTNGGDKTEEILGDDEKDIDTEIPSKEDERSTPLLTNTIEESSGKLKTGSKSENFLLESTPTTHTETRGIDNISEHSIEKGISNETNIDSSYRNEKNETNIKTENQCEDIDRLVTEKENINKVALDGANDSHHISVDDVQKKINTETSSEHKIMSSEIPLQTSIVEHDSNEEAAAINVGSEVGGDSEKRGVNEVSGKGTGHSSPENEIIGTISDDEVGMKDGSEENYDDVTINKKSENFKDENIESLEKSLGKSSSEHEKEVMDNATSEIMIDNNNKLDKKEYDPNDQQLTGEQSNIEVAPKATPGSLPDKEHDETMTNEAKDASKTDEPFEDISSRKEQTEIFHDRIGKAENGYVLENRPVEGKEVTEELSEQHTKNGEEKDISNTYSATDKESLHNAGNESISRNEYAENEEIIEKNSAEDRGEFGSQKTPYISDKQSYTNLNDKSIVPESSDDLGVERTESKTANIITNNTENSELGNDDTKSYIEENEMESSHKTEKLLRNMSDGIESEEKGKFNIQKPKDHQDDQSSTGSIELKNIDPETTEESETTNYSNEVSEDILIQKGNNEEDNTKIDTTKINELSANISNKIEMDEIDKESATQNLKEKQEELSSNYKNMKNFDSEESELNETKTDQNSSIRDAINPSEAIENIIIPKELKQLNNSNTVPNEAKERLNEGKTISIQDREAFDINGYGSADITNKKVDITLTKTNDEHDTVSAIDGSSELKQNLKLENSQLEQRVDYNKDDANILSDETQSERNKRSLEQENEFSKNTKDFDTKSHIKNEHEFNSDSKEIEKESHTETNSGDLKLNPEIYQHVDETDSKAVSDINAENSDEKQKDTDTSENKTNDGIVDKVAKNYISYVIDNENYLKYNHDDNDRKEDDTSNSINGISDDKPKTVSTQPNKFDENLDIQENDTDKQIGFDRLKLREELGIPSMEEPHNSEREALKRNISSTLSIAETGLIDTPVKAFINNFISNEKGKQFEKEDEKANNEEHKMMQSTKVESEDIVLGSEDEKNYSNTDGLQSNESFDRSKLREELQKIEQESKLTSFKQSFNPSLLRQELENAALLKKSTKNNGYSSTLAKGAAVVRIQSMWRGFIVRKSFSKPQYDGEFSVHRDENSNVYQKKNQEPIESKLNTSSIEDKGNNEDPKLMEAVTTVQRCWRGFKVRKHLNSIKMKQNSLGSARIKRHVDDKNIDFFDTMMAAIKIQKIWRGFITRKKLNITKKIVEECENEKVVDGTNEELIQNQKPSVKTENTYTIESHESISNSDNGITVKQIENQMPLMKNDGNTEVSKTVPGSESNMHTEMTSKDILKTGNTSKFAAQKTNEDDKKIIDYATKIQSIWRGFLVRKYIKQLKNQMDNKKAESSHITDEGNFPKDESQRPASIDSNDSSKTVIFNDINKKSEGVKPYDDHLLGLSMNHRDFDDVDASLDEILEYPLIKDEHLIDDYQNELLDRISGKQIDSGNDTIKTLETVSSKRIDEIKAEDMKDIGTLHTSLLSNSGGQARNESQVEQIHPRSKLESVIEESPSHTADNLIDLNAEQANGMTTTTEKEGVDSETEENKLSFCSEPSAPPCESKVINGKPLSDYVEEIEAKPKSLSSGKGSKIERNEDVEPASKIDSANIISNDIVQHIMEENADREFESISAGNAQISDLKNVKLLHSGEWHDSIVVPLPKVVTESLNSDSQKGKIGHFQGSEASEKSLDSTADISSILSNSSAGLLHTGEMHDGIVVPISLASLGRTVPSDGENNGIDTVDTHTQAAQNPEVQTCNDTTNNGASSVAVRVLQAPEPEVLTSPIPITAAGDVTNADEGRRAQTPNKEDLRIQSQVSPSVSQSMESEGAGKTQEKNMEAQAATKIQAGFRGYQVRKQLKLKNGSSDMNPPKRQCRGKCSGRSDSAKSQINRPKDVEEKSAVKIQAGVRGFLVRRRQKKQNNQES